MNQKQFVRMTVDCAMTGILLLLMGYSKVGEAAHEWLGIAMFALFVIHHILNRRWTAGIFKGRYMPYRVLQTVLAALIFCTMIGSAVSGVMLSKHIFGSLNIGGTAFARTLHMLCGYWNFVLMSLHFGLHWEMIAGMVGKALPKDRPSLKWIAHAAALLTAAYGVYALISRQMLEYLFGATTFAFFDTTEPLILFLLDYITIMVLFVWIGHYVSKYLKSINRRKTT